MTHAISVPTPFNDIAELAESFASRADEERLMLPHHEPIPEGEWVQFVVAFADGSSALAGVGRCTGAYDNGEDRAPEHRFDIVMDSLDLDDMGQVYFERILVVRASQMGAEPVTGEVSVDEAYGDAGTVQPVVEDAHAVDDLAAPADAAYDPAFAGQPDDEPAMPAEQAYTEQAYAEQAYAEQPYAEQPYAEPQAYAEQAYAEPQAYGEADPYAEPQSFAEPAGYAEPAPSYEESPAESYAAPEDDWVSESTQMGDIASLTAQPAERLAAPVNAIYELPPPVAPGQLPSPHASVASLTRRRIAASWTPEPALRPDPSPSSGLFQYGDNGLPRPAQAPRPQLDPSLRVVRAPRPGDPLAAPLMRTGGAAAAAVAYQQEEMVAYAQEEEVYAASEAAYDDEGYAEDAYDSQELADVSTGEYGEVESETRQVDIGGLGDEAYAIDDVGVPEDDEY